MTIRCRWLVALALVVGLGGCRKHAPSGTVRVAAAADLARAFEEVGRAFKAKTGTNVVFTFGSSGLLAKQLGEGAPFDLYAAASKSYVTQVVDKGACDGATRAMYGRGRLVVWSKGQALATPADLAEPRFAKIAIANPDHAPYGKAAKQALERLGLWDQVSPKLVFAENVQVTMQWAQDGSADASIVALSLATVTTGGTSIPVDPANHDPLDQELVVCGKGAGRAGAEAFAAFVASPAGRDIMRNYGFRLPGE
ncbi:MAG: molybdate ABC transporter substrate-binding protein [Myxococcales bacterium]|nr:molybdate ABC transporter substrate-binding protein [Myxococcales bacterium]